MAHRQVAHITIVFIYSVGFATTGARYLGILEDYQRPRPSVPCWKAMPFILMTIPIAIAWPITFPLMEYHQDVQSNESLSPFLIISSRPNCKCQFFE